VNFVPEQESGEQCSTYLDDRIGPISICPLPTENEYHEKGAKDQDRGQKIELLYGPRSGRERP
jgi:hypothetical protein